jgi:salicylate hydroxylase
MECRHGDGQVRGAEMSVIELAAPRMTIAERSVGGLGPTVALRRPNSDSEIPSRTVEAKRVGVVMALTARPARAVQGRGPGPDELVHRHWRGGRDIAVHPVSSVHDEYYGVAHGGVQGVAL